DRHVQSGGQRRGEDGGRTQVLGVVHQHFLARVRVEDVVAVDAVPRRRVPGGDGHVVRVGQRGDRTVGAPAHAASGGEQVGQPGHPPGRDGLLVVGRFTAVDADHHYGFARVLEDPV